MPKITVLMTVYNGEPYLHEAIASVLQQDFSDFELLIVDDCSTDNTVSIIESFQDARIRIERNTVNLGQTKSLNRGLALAKSDYIARIDADDMALSHWLSSQYDCLQNHPEATVISCFLAMINKQGGLIGDLRIPSEMSALMLRSLFASPINHGGALFKKETILSAGGYDETFRVAADYALWSTLFEQHKHIVVNQHVLMKIRFHEESITKKEKNDKDLPEVATIIKNNIKNIATYELNEQELWCLYHFIYSPSLLTIEQINSSLKIIDQIQHNIVKIKVYQDQADAFFQQFIKNTVIKGLFLFAHQGNIKGAKELLKQWNGLVFSVLSFFALFGCSGLKCAESFYKFYRQFKTRMALV